MKNIKSMLLIIVVALCSCVSQTTGFALDLHQLSPLLQNANNVIASASATAPSFAPGAPLVAAANDLLENYKHALQLHPLQTKMITGAILATLGDAIAQSREPEVYDKRRAASFAAFDMSYRALQHKVFPIIVQHCHGQYILGAIASVAPALASTMTDPKYFAAMEQTLGSQLGVVPFIYYPVFFALTGAVQGLSVDGAIERAKENFLPLMERNLLFWIPVQFIQFGFIEESLQIPFLCICGLGWTCILSVMAGSTKEYSYCVTGMEGECILPDELFPIEEMAHDIEEIVHDMEEKVHEIEHDIEEIVHDMEEKVHEIEHDIEVVVRDTINVALHLETDDMENDEIEIVNGVVEEEEEEEAAEEKEEVLMK